MNRKLIILLSVAFLSHCSPGHQPPTFKHPDELAKPTDVQYRWHEQERIMFVCLDPCTWQGQEYDDHSIPL